MNVKTIIATLLLTLVTAGAFAQSSETMDAQPSPVSQKEQEDNAAAAAKSMAKSSRGKVTEGVSPKAMMYFVHKRNSKYDTQMTLNRVGNLYRLMPRKLKKEIGQIYYPALREGLQAKDAMKFMEADASKEVLDDGTMRIELSFPKFYLTLDHVNWADLDQLFLTYFKH